MTEKEIIKDLDNIKPIDHGTIAKPHTPVYKMHRYFARRPYSVFSELIKHYSNPGSIILDPFCGGGVTVVEGLRLKRKVIGVDINPMATFITRMEVIDVDLEELQKAFEEIEAKVKDEILELYMTKCPKCGKETPAEWFEWSAVFNCQNCSKPILADESEKVRNGWYRCGACKEVVKTSECVRSDNKVQLVHLNCQHCRTISEKIVNDFDTNLIIQIERRYDDMQSRGLLFIPSDDIPDADRQRDDALFQKGITKFMHLFTKRNLIANSMLKKSILDSSFSAIIKTDLMFGFSASLRFTNIMVFRNPGWQGGKPIEWAKHAYWIPDIFIEQNALGAFINRKNTLLRGWKYAKKELVGFNVQANTFRELEGKGNYFVLTSSADKLPELPDNSVDMIITDPPYGGNVQYAELSDFWVVWLKETLGVNGIIDTRDEAIQTRHSGFPTAKSLSHYRNKLEAIFQECHRVLKPKRWMVMTFHNKEFKIWNAIHLAAHDAGFVLAEEDGMIYQSPIRQYIGTAHTKAQGSMLGDFILSFRRVEKLPEKKMIEYVEIEKRIQELAAEAVLHHKGASLSTIYMKIMPFLLNNNLLEKIHENDLPPYLRDSFVERDGKWYLKENIGDPLRDYLSDYSKGHYKEDYKVLDFVPVEARLEYLIRRKLYSPPGYATQDEILNEIYSNLINSNAAEYGEINRVLNKIAKLVPGPKDKRKVWRLKEDIERQEKLDLIEEKVKEIVGVSEESEHDLVIRRLVELGAKEGYASHIGRTEQKKYVEFRKLSLPMANNVQYGMDKKGFEIVTEIDVLWLKGDTIVSAFEVEKTTTIDSGINRFRNLFAVQPNTNIETYIVAPNKRKKEVEKKLTSPANMKNGLTGKIGYILFDDLDIKGSVDKIDFPKIKRKVE